MVDNLVKEVADILQIVGFGFPKGDPEAPLVEIGLGSVDVGKPVILCIGHNVAPGKEIIDYLRRKNLLGKVEICGICCTAHDLTRYEKGAKIIGPLSRQIHFIRSGVADVIVVDEQCVRTDILEEAKRLKIPVIATSDKICYGLPDMTSLPAGEIVERISGEFPGAFLLDPEKVGEVATEVALRISPSRSEMKKIPQISTLVKLAGSCTKCDDCRRLCPYDLPIPEAMESAKKGDVSMLGGFWDVCGGCGRCNSCRRKLPVSDMIFIASQHLIRKSRARLRSGRGPIQDTEIREVGRPIVFGEIPGVIAYVGCANYPAGWKELAKMAEEFLQRRYIVVASGCSAMDLAMQKDEEGRSLYEKYPGAFDASNLTNVGSCVANAHIIGAAIKIANIFAKRNLRANFEEIADYILGRVGACGVAWGAMSQKAAAIATGCNRWGIPVIIGPHGSKYRRLYLGRKDIKEDWMVYDVRREGELSYFGPAPEHLLYSAETAEEAIVMTAKLCIRANDTTMGRQIKLTHYLDLYEKYFGGLPDDWWMLVRTRADLPIVRRDELLRELDRMGWKPSPIPDPTNLERFKMGWK
jgi:acetyl-CoA decarbonylase/synthase complex subunit alpha